MTTTILVIEDDRQIRKVVESYLQQDGYRVLTAPDGLSGLALAQQEKPALLVLDLMLPGLDGWEIARRLRASSDPAVAGIYIMMLTVRIEESERLTGLELGADDYVTKPFSPRELVARVGSALRCLELQADAPASLVLQVDDLRLDPGCRQMTLGGAPVDLTSTEFNLLHHLMRHPNRPFSRDQLLDVIQGEVNADLIAYERTVDAHIKNLRQKLGGSGRHSRFIETVHGIGYRFVASPSQPPCT